MHYLDKTLDQIKKALDEKQITTEELVKESIERATKYQKDYNSFVTITENEALNSIDNLKNISDNPLKGIPFAAKDNFSTKDILSTGSSNILKNYIPFFDATAITKLYDKGSILIGKTVLDELAMGGTGTTGHTGVVRNPWDKTRIIGGSSAGSASSVILGITPYALGSDTGDSIRKPAGYGGIVGYKPTYGLISRYGVFAFASSMDTVGCFTKTVKDTAIVIDALKGKDEKDMTSYEDKNDYEKSLTKDIKNKKIFYIKEFNDALKSNQEIYDNFNDTINKLKETGAIIEEVSIDKELLKSILPAYFVISCAEATSNNSNLTGIIFGNREDGTTADEIMFNTRTKGFSEFIKRRFILGSFILQKENQEKLFKNGQRIRRLITNKINELFKEYDAFIMPNGIDIAPKFEEKADRLSDDYLVLEQALAIANFGGYPSLTIPSGMVKNMPVAVNITGPVKHDLDVLNIGYALEEKIAFKQFEEKGEQ